MKPLIFFSYGVTKSGSTLAFELARVALEQAGFSQPRLASPGLVVSRKINAVEHVTEAEAEALLEDVRRIGHPIVLKTHTRPDPAVIALVRDGHATAHAVVRDPRDVALSMIDHGNRSRVQGRPAFAEILSLDDAMTAISNQFEQLAEWLALPGVRVLRYDDLAFGTAGAAAEILDHLGIPGDAQRIAETVLSSSFTQFNKGVRDRYRSEMTLAESAEFHRRFRPFYNRVLNGGGGAPLPFRAGMTLETHVAMERSA